MSTLMPVTPGTEPVQLPARSQIEGWVPVMALPVSVPGGTEVDSVNEASVAFARPEPVSQATHGTCTSVACQSSPTVPQATWGAAWSSTFSHIRTSDSAELKSGPRSPWLRPRSLMNSGYWPTWASPSSL